jgi:hypothetical protein
MFNEDSGLVRVWVRLIQDGKRAIDEVPNLFNLRGVVEGLIAQ